MDFIRSHAPSSERRKRVLFVGKGLIKYILWNRFIDWELRAQTRLLYGWFFETFGSFDWDSRRTILWFLKIGDEAKRDLSINQIKKMIFVPKASAIALPTSPPPAIVISTFSAGTGGFGQSWAIVPSDDTEYDENRIDIKDRRSNNNCLIYKIMYVKIENRFPNRTKRY
jgi:hypothetical protein